MAQKKPKEVWIDHLKMDNDIIPVNSGNYQDSFLYGKSIEALDYNTGIKNKPETTSMNACLIQSGTQNISTATQTALTTLTSVSGDTTMTATANQITITQAWTYLISLSFFDASWSATWVRNAIINKNGSNAFIARRIPSASSGLDVSASYPLVLSIGDIIKMDIYQDSWISMTASTAFISAVKIT